MGAPIITADDFLGKLQRGGDESCWPWCGKLVTHGYGQLTWNKKLEQAHRVAHRLFIGNVPDGMYVLHKCDNPPCCNPNHLFLGTQLDNMLDAKAKRRTRLKFSDSEVVAMRTLFASGVSASKVAKEFKATVTVVLDAITGRTYQWVGGEISADRARHSHGEYRPFVKLKDSDIPEIRRLRAAGHTFTAIAKMYGVANPTITKAIRRETWKHIA